MTKTVRERNSNLPYSLHDAHIKKITILKDKIIFDFKYIFLYSNDGEESTAKASIEFENADSDFCDIYIMDVGKKGKIKGKKQSLKKFLKKHKKLDMEIVTETYNYYDIVWSGYLYCGKKIKEFIITVWNDGNMVYYVEESTTSQQVVED